MRIISRFLSILLVIFLSTPVYAQTLIHIVAAENTYGEVARELGGQYVEVNSILTNPNQDPHLFMATSGTVKSLTQATIVIYNGAGYDPWMSSLLKMDGRSDQQKIDVSALVDIQAGANPHIWYLPKTMPIFAKTLVEMLSKEDPGHAAYYQANLKQFNQQYQPILDTIGRLKVKLQNTSVIATEPVFNYMAESLGLVVRGLDFQVNMMNDVPPSVTQIKSFEDDLYQHRVKLLIYNNQVINPMTEHMRKIAEKEKIPVVGVSETLPPGLTYINWMLKELKGVENALLTH